MSIPEVDSRNRLIAFLKNFFAEKGAAAGAGGSNTQVQYNSSGDLAGSSNLTFDGTDLTVGGDLTVTGNDIKGSGGTAITMDGSNNVTVAADLTVTGGDITLGAATSYIKDSGGDNRIKIDANYLYLLDNGGSSEFYATDGECKAYGNFLVGGDLTVTGNDIKGSGGTAITMDGSNHVTTPSNPAFGVWDNDDQAISENAWTTIAFDQENFDVGGDFASNTFTAPVTGKYMLSAQVRLAGIDSSNSQYVWIKIITSNRTYYHLDGTRYYAGADYATPSLSVVADMDASDTAYVQILVRIGASTTQGSENENYTAFQGVLIG